MRLLRCLPVLIPAALAGGPAVAQSAEPFADARLRYERADQQGAAETADALTLMTRAGAEWSLAETWYLLGELEAVSVLAGDYGAGPSPFGPAIPDSAVIDLNRLQLIYEDRTRYVSLGRQALRYGDERFIGDSDWRQDDRTHDAVRIDIDPAPGWRLSYAYSWRVNQPNGRRDDADGDLHVLSAEWTRSGAFRMQALTLLADLEGRQPTATYALRATGDLPAGPAVFTYDAAIARQTDYRTGPSLSLDHAGLEGRLSLGPVSAWAGVEHWEGDGVRGFDLPVAELHVRRGWADAFSQIRAEGVTDAYAGARAEWPAPPFGERWGASLVYHAFEPSRGASDFGDEWNLGLDAKLNRRWGVSVQFAAYDGGPGGPADREKLFLSLDWAY